MEGDLKDLNIKQIRNDVQIVNPNIEYIPHHAKLLHLNNKNKK